MSTLPSAPRPNINDMRLSLPTGRGTRTPAPTQKTATSVRPRAAPSTLRAPFPVLQTVRALAPPFRAATPSQIDLPQSTSSNVTRTGGMIAYCLPSNYF